MPAAGVWFEVRSNSAAALEGIELPKGWADEDAFRSEGALSLVVDEGPAQVHKLPSIYFGQAQVFADRDLEVVRRELVERTQITIASFTEALYALVPCRYRGKVGLYGRDFFNRATFRRRLERLGVEFAPDSHVTLREEGFVSSTWGPIQPSFVVLALHVEDPAGVENTSGGFLVFGIAGFRLGAVSQAEMGLLARILRGVKSFSAQDPKVLLDALDAELG